MELLNKLKRVVKSSVALVCLFILVSSTLFLLHSGLPDVSLDNGFSTSYKALVHEKDSGIGLGKMGQMMIGMLPDDLAFTIFVPSEEAFGRVLNLRANDSLVQEKMNDTFAILSRVMGFSAVPQHLPSGIVPLKKEVSLDSVSGFRLYVWRAADGSLVVNNVMSEQVDLRKAEIIVHIIEGVIADAEFEQLFSLPDYEDEPASAVAF